MPMHDWRIIESGLYHDFHGSWLFAIRDILNSGLLGDEYYALAEQVTSEFKPDVVALTKRERSSTQAPGSSPTVALLDQGRMTKQLRKRNRLSIRHVSHDRVVAVIELVSPGNKDDKKACADFIRKAFDLLAMRINFLYIDPFAPTNQDPNGLHARIWKKLLPKKTAHHATADQPLMSVSYGCLDHDEIQAAIERFAVGDKLPAMPLHLDEEWITLPLEETYMQAWDKYPKLLKERYFL